MARKRKSSLFRALFSEERIALTSVVQQCFAGHTFVICGEKKTCSHAWARKGEE